MPKVIIAGCGFLGEAAAVLFSRTGWDVLGLCHSEASVAALKKKGFVARVQDITVPFPLDRNWHDVDALVHCASTAGGGAAEYKAVYLDGLLNAMTAFRPRRSLFTSSTSVYGQTDGSWVDENSPAQPSAETGKILRDAEEVTLISGGYVARLAGLYGPERSVLLKRMLAGEAQIDGAGDRWINQIHRDDAARAIFELFHQRAESGVYNVVDNTPMPQREVYRWLADYLDRPMPPSGEPKSRRRGATNKRVSNAKLRAIGWDPVFPSFRDALPALVSRA